MLQLVQSSSTRRRRQGLALAALAAAATAGLSLPTRAATYTGAGTDSNWSNSANWTPTLPANGEDVFIADTTTQNALTLNDGAHTIGALNFGTSGARGSNSANFTITSGTAAANLLTINGGLNANGPLTGPNFLINTQVAVQGDQTWSVAGAVGSPATDQGVSIANATNTVAVNFDISGGKITKTGVGQLLIIGRNVGNGSIDINQGAVKLNAGNSTTLTVNGTGTITVNNTGSLFIAANSGTLSLSKAIKINDGGTVSVGGNRTLVSTVASQISVSGTNVTVNQNSTTAGQVTNFTGPWTGTGTINFTLSGSGSARAMVLSGDNSGLAAQITNKAILSIGTTTPLGTGVYRADTASTLQSSDTNARTINNVVDLAADTAFGNTAATTGDLTFTGLGDGTGKGIRTDGTTIRGIATGNGAKTITVNNTRVTFNCVVNDGGAATANALTKAGTGTLVFGVANTYNRPTVINAGTLQLTGTGTLGSATNSGTVTVADAGLLQLDVAGLSDTGTLSVNSSDTTAEVAIASGVSDNVNGLIINGVPMAIGTYGSTASGAANPGLANPNDIFSGTGMLNVTALAVVPEPGTLGLAGIAVGGLLAGRRRKR